MSPPPQLAVSPLPAWPSRRDRGSELCSAVGLLPTGREVGITDLLELLARHHGPTLSHGMRVGAYSVVIAEGLGMGAERLRAIRLAATLHDLGKLRVSADLLDKPARLDARERRELRRHAELGYRLLSGLGHPVLELSAQVALCHHERWDGLGYPRRMGGADIPLPARVVAVADVLDALTSERPYRSRLTLGRAIEVIEEHRGSHFDPVVVDALVRQARPSRGCAGPTGPPGIC